MEFWKSLGQSFKKTLQTQNYRRQLQLAGLTGWQHWKQGCQSFLGRDRSRQDQPASELVCGAALCQAEHLLSHGNLEEVLPDPQQLCAQVASGNRRMHQTREPLPVPSPCPLTHRVLFALHLQEQRARSCQWDHEEGRCTKNSFALVSV